MEKTIGKLELKGLGEVEDKAQYLAKIEKFEQEIEDLSEEINELRENEE